MLPIVKQLRGRVVPSLRIEFLSHWKVWKRTGSVRCCGEGIHGDARRRAETSYNARCMACGCYFCLQQWSLARHGGWRVIVGGHNANGQSGSSKNDSEWCGYNTCGVYVWFRLLLRVILTRKTKDRQAESTRVRIRDGGNVTPE